MERDVCVAFVERVARNAAEHYPAKTISRITITTKMGSYDLFFTDGTGIGADVN